MRLQQFLLISFCLLWGASCDDDVSKLKVTINPNCTLDCDPVHVVHIQADSDKDRLHYIYDFTGKPAVLIAKGDKNSFLEIDWDDFKNHSTEKSVRIIPRPTYASSSFINYFVVFNDTKDRSNFSDPSVVDYSKINPLDINWMLAKFDNSSEQNMTIEMIGKYKEGGNFSIKYTTYTTSAHAVELPHLFHTSHSMQIDIVARNINSTYKNPRIAFQLVMVPDETKNEGDFQMNRIRNLDDEFTPGIFDVYNLVSPRSNNDTRGSFIQYRPVCYISETRSVSSSTESRHGYPMNVTGKIDYTLPHAFYDKIEFSRKIHQAVNITFGIPGDGFYSRTNYISFSYLMGIGNPPLEGLSPFVITFAVIGLGVPLLVLIVGGTYVAIKRYSN